jgi:TorA maturation chaperone TorD
LTEDKTNWNDLDYIQARSNVYGLFAICFYAPTQSLVEYITDGTLTEAFRESLDGFTDEVDNALESILTYACKTDSGQQEDLLQQMKIEYNRLFVGPGRPVAQPYESPYRDDVRPEERGLLMNSVAVQVRKEYQSAGIALTRDFHDLPDHVAAELEFLHFIGDGEAGAWERGDHTAATGFHEQQRAFFTQHLGLWIDRFCDAVEQGTKMDLYRNLAILLRRYMREQRLIFESETS